MKSNASNSKDLRWRFSLSCGPNSRLTLAAAAVACLVGAGQAGAQPVEQNIPVRATGPIKYAAGKVLVQPRAGLSDKEFDKILSQHGGKRADHIKQINVHVISLPAQANEEAVVRALSKNPHIKFAELDIVGEPAATTNDPKLSSEWHIPKIQANTAWDSSAGAAITIAVLDTGVDATHPDLGPALVPGWNVYDNTSNTSDGHGHGTWVSGAAAGVGNNAVGLAGVAWQARIMPVRITDSSGSTTLSHIAKGVTWAADNGAKVVNVSYSNACGWSSIISAAQYLRGKGGVLVVAAGNTSGEIADIASTEITCVSATDSTDVRASWSSYGQAIDVAAPGVNILTTTIGGGYANGNGTSFAAPVTAGTYALIMAANKSLPPSTLDSVLFSTAQDLGTAGYDKYYGNGRINAGAAVAKASQTVLIDTAAPSVAVSSPTGGSKVTGVVPVDVSASDASGVAKVELYANGVLVGSDTSSPYGFSWDVTNLADGSATLMAKAYDTKGNIGSSASVSVTVANDAVAPTVSITNPANGSTVSGTVSINVSAQDNVKVSKITLTIDGKQVAQSLGSSLAYSWSTGSGAKGRKSTSGTKSTISAKAEDAAGNFATTSVSVTKQ